MNRIKVLFVRFYADTTITRQDRGPEVGDKALQVVISGRQDLFDVKYGIERFKNKLFINDVKLNWADVILYVDDVNTIPQMYRHKILTIAGAPINKNHWNISNKERNFNSWYGDLTMGFACLSPYHRRYIIEHTNVDHTKLPIISYPLHPIAIAMMPDIIPTEKRAYDVLLYIKFIDMDFEKFTLPLIDKLKNSPIKWTHIQYGFYNRKQLLNLANNSRTCLVLSYYETQGIALMEIASMGCYMITFEEGFSLITEKTGVFIPELSKGIYNDIIFDNIMKPKVCSCEAMAEISRELYDGRKTCDSIVAAVNQNMQKNKQT